jgi:hypothetical protein
MKTTRLITLFALAPVLLAACAATGRTPDGSEEANDSRPGSETAPPSSTGMVPEAPREIPDEVWVAILADLEQRLGAPVVDLTIQSAVAETWTDGSLGCPVPGQLYTQALVDGYWVVLEIDDEHYDYRVGNGTDVRLCENPPP